MWGWDRTQPVAHERGRWLREQLASDPKPGALIEPAANSYGGPL
jgi:hypothetical protein